jgi:hypothetical protein
LDINFPAAGLSRTKAYLPFEKMSPGAPILRFMQNLCRDVAPTGNLTERQMRALWDQVDVNNVGRFIAYVSYVTVCMNRDGVGMLAAWYRIFLMLYKKSACARLCVNVSRLCMHK